MHAHQSDADDLKDDAPGTAPNDLDEALDALEKAAPSGMKKYLAVAKSVAAMAGKLSGPAQAALKLIPQAAGKLGKSGTRVALASTLSLAAIGGAVYWNTGGTDSPKADVTDVPTSKEPVPPPGTPDPEAGASTVQTASIEDPTTQQASAVAPVGEDAVPEPIGSAPTAPVAGGALANTGQAVPTPLVSAPLHEARLEGGTDGVVPPLPTTAQAPVELAGAPAVDVPPQPVAALETPASGSEPASFEPAPLPLSAEPGMTETAALAQPGPAGEAEPAEVSGSPEVPQGGIAGIAPVAAIAGPAAVAASIPDLSTPPQGLEDPVLPATSEPDAAPALAAQPATEAVPPAADPSSGETISLPNSGSRDLLLEQPMGEGRPIETTPISLAAAVGGDELAQPTVAVAEALDPVLHVVQRGENFWTISRLYYGSGRFYKALWKANADQFDKPEALHVGATIKVPPPEALDRSLIASSSEPEPRPPSSRPDMAASKRSTATTASDSVVMLPGKADLRSTGRLDTLEPESSGRVYVVSSNNETLRSVARDQLGDSRREDEIRNMNLDALGDRDRLVRGMRLRLPDDPDRTARR